MAAAAGSSSPRNNRWLERTAITWLSRDAISACSPYWDQKLLLQISSLCSISFPFNGNDGVKEGVEVEDQCSISYESLFLVTTFVVNALRRIIHSLQIGNETTTTKKEVGIPIAVAIPEGPLLPLAILAVHVLGEPRRASKEPSSLYRYAILVPIDPSEGRDRLRYMMNDSQPAIVLCLPGEVSNRIDNAHSIDGAGILVDDHSLSRINIGTPQTIDFSKIVYDAIARCEQEIRSTGLPLLRNLMSEPQNDQLNISNLIAEASQLIMTTAANDQNAEQWQGCAEPKNRISHIVYTSGTTGIPKGCISSMQSLRHYIGVKNKVHELTATSIVLLASALSFDPCLSDVLATFESKCTLAVTPRKLLVQDLVSVISSLKITHILCTPTLWSMVHSMGTKPDYFSSLKVVALGGEPIPKPIVSTWARDTNMGQSEFNSRLKLLATYGVTESCVYQTCGEVFQNDEGVGQNVGLPLPGLFFDICRTQHADVQPNVTTNMSQHKLHSGIGEVVLYGKQLDQFSSYLSHSDFRPDKFTRKDVHSSVTGQSDMRCYYNTGDRGYINPETNNLHILGRVEGEESMIKINGVRIELGEIEAAIIDESNSDERNLHPLVTDCLASVTSEPDSPKQIQAYCVLSCACLKEMGLFHELEHNSGGILCATGPLMQLLRGRCMEKVKPGCIPSAYIIIRQLPLSPSGKRDRSKLPPLSECTTMEASHGRGSDGRSIPLSKYGVAGDVVAESICHHLNLQECQMSVLTSTSSFAMLGGDSLTATLVVRALYAAHNGIKNSRFLGGAYGVLGGSFAASNLLQAASLGAYVDFLDNHGVCQHRQEGKLNLKGEVNNDVDNQFRNDEQEDHHHSLRLREALIEATSLSYSTVAIALLNLGVDPNSNEHGGRLSKSDRNERKQKFKSNPLHLVCSRGDDVLVKILLQKGCKFTSPDAAGSYPMLLACSRANDACISKLSNANADQDMKRKECVRLLLDAGAPLAMKDGNKQTVLHCAARSGHRELLKFLMKRWKDAGDRGEINVYTQVHKGGRFDWTDRWFRTPVHWAILNGNVDSLSILLEGGCSANPYKPKAGGSQRQTSLVIESPLEICMRLYDESEGIGKEICCIIRGAP